MCVVRVCVLTRECSQHELECLLPGYGYVHIYELKTSAFAPPRRRGTWAGVAVHEAFAFRNSRNYNP
eukprot:SAG22_NODE_613_length_8567_cov_4.215163_9_plen_67_part_00